MKANKPLLTRWWVFIGGLVMLSLACGWGGGSATPLPPGRPANFDVQVASPTPDPRQNRAQPVAEIDPVDIVPLDNAPTHTPDPNATPTPLRLPTQTPTLPPTPTTDADTLEAVGIELTTEPEPEPTIEPPNEPLANQPTTEPEDSSEPTVVEPEDPPALAPEELDPALEGGDWDFEADYIPWPNPHGEPCPGASVASGWTAFAEAGPYGSSCFNENLYQPNVFSGIKSQEITFDFIAANSGVYRTIPTQAGHRYTIVAYAKHDRSIAPVEVFLGIDLTGGGAWDADTVEWFPWDESSEDAWAATEETVTATGDNMTIFVRGYHPMADQGGKTVIDNVSVVHLGP